MKPGDVIEGRYLVEALLGEGGMARVFRVRHVGLGSLHALKVLNPDLAERVEVRTRFAAEGQIQAQIRHPNIVAVTEVVSEPGLQGLVMDFVDGTPLDAYLAGLKGPPSFEVVQSFMLPVLDAIGLAHRHGIVHRDLKPENILVGHDAQGRPWPRVTDFGIAKVRQEVESDRATRTGTSMGTRGYMSPEQIKSSKDVNARSDIFSLGATLYEVATLTQAFGGDSDYEVMDRIVHERYPPPQQIHPGIDGRIARAIVRALKADPEARFATCEEFSLALQQGPVDEEAPARAFPGGRPSDDSSAGLHWGVPRPAGSGRRDTAEEAPGVGRPDTSPDRPSAVLDALTFAPVVGIADEAAPVELPRSVFESTPASESERVRAAQALRAWMASWPESLRGAMNVVDVEQLPVHRLRLRATFERRDCRVRDVPFPAGAIPPSEGSPRDDVDPYAVALPVVQVEEGRVETFVVAGTAVVRACTACRGQGGVTCADCGGSGGTRCVACSGTGSAGCVLCDGIGSVPKLGGEGFTLCPSCRGTNVVPCSGHGCEGGVVVCTACEGKGTKSCHFCSGAGSLARATVISRAARSGHAHLIVEHGIRDSVRALAETLPGHGEAVASFVASARGPELDPRLAPFVEHADAMAAKAMTHWGPGWRITHRSVDLNRVRVLGVRYTVGDREHQVHLVGEAPEVIGQPTPLEAWRQAQLVRVVELAEKRELRALKAVDLSSGFDSGDTRLGEVSRWAAAHVESLWDRGEVRHARDVRDALPGEVSAAAAEALFRREERRRTRNRERATRTALAIGAAAAALGAAWAFVGHH